MKRFLPLIAAGCAAVMMSGCVFLPDEEEVLDPPTVKANEAKYSTYSVEKKDLVKKVMNSGTIASVHQYDMSFEAQSGVIAEIAVRPGEKVKKGDLICRLDTYDLDYSITEKELYVKRAQLSKTVLEQQKATQAEIDKAQVDIDIQQNELDTLLEQKDAASLYATVGGTVASLGDFSKGDTVEAGAVLATIIDTENLYLAIKPTDYTVFKMDTKVQIRVDEDYYDGKVFLTPDALKKLTDKERKDADIAYESDMVYVKFTGDVPSESVGVLADVVLVLDERKDVVVIPNTLLKTVNGQTVVYLLQEGVKLEQPVEVGLQTGSESEITSGLSVGDEIVIR